MIFFYIFDSSEDEQLLLSNFDFLNSQILIFDWMVDKTWFIAKITRIYTDIVVKFEVIELSFFFS